QEHALRVGRPREVSVDVPVGVSLPLERGDDVAVTGSDDARLRRGEDLVRIARMRTERNERVAIRRPFEVRNVQVVGTRGTRGTAPNGHDPDPRPTPLRLPLECAAGTPVLLDFGIAAHRYGREGDGAAVWREAERLDDELARVELLRF